MLSVCIKTEAYLKSTANNPSVLQSDSSNHVAYRGEVHYYFSKRLDLAVNKMRGKKTSLSSFWPFLSFCPCNEKNTLYLMNNIPLDLTENLVSPLKSTFMSLLPVYKTLFPLILLHFKSLLASLNCGNVPGGAKSNRRDLVFIRQNDKRSFSEMNLQLNWCEWNDWKKINR